MHQVDQLQRMADTVEKIGIAKRNVLGTHLDLSGNIAEDDGSLHNPKFSLIDRHDRTMSAEMFAAPASLSVSNNALLTIWKVQVCVML
jgi:hypothetical protein